MVKILTLMAIVGTSFRSVWLAYGTLNMFCSYGYMGCLWNQTRSSLWAIFLSLCLHFLLTVYDFCPNAHRIERDAIKIVSCMYIALLLEQ